MLYIRKLFTQDLRDGKQIAFPKEVSYSFFSFDYINKEEDRKITFTFRANFGQFQEFDGKEIRTRLYAAGSESRMDGEVKAFIRDELNAQVNDLLIFKSKGTKHVDYDVMFVPQSNYQFYPLLLNLSFKENHSVYVAEDEIKDEMKENEEKQLSFQQIYFGAPGTGKSHAVEQITNKNNSIRTTFHPDSDYSTFVGCYKPIKKTDGPNEITYDFVPQAFTQAYIKAWKNLGEPFYLVIEEINRGNCAQIFGDIFQLLDRDSATGYSNYKITPDQDLQLFLANEFANCDIEDEEIKTGVKMQLPRNLHILATMNTSDQSLFPIDSAFKRRWDWKYIPIDYTDLGHYIICGDKQYKWTDFLAEVNQRIEAVTQSEDKKLGAWFVKAINNEISAEKFVSKVVFYLWNDIYKDFAHDASTIFKGNYDKFHKFFDFKGDVKLDILNEFLLGLNLTSINNGYIPDVSEADDNNTSAKKKFTLNGTPMYLGDIAQHVVQTYAQNHPNENSQTIRDTFVQWCPKITSIVETEEEYNIRKAKNTTTEGRSSSITLSNGEVLYITKQWSAKRPTDNFFQFMQVCQNNNLGDIKSIEQ